ncbi:MAG: dipeptide epimerase [Isosphaeraceae bacterium]
MVAIRRAELYHVALPLKTRVKHASHDRITSDNLIVRVELSDGSVGYGEGVPRSYVTGETVESTFAALRQIDLPRQIGLPADMSGVVRALDALEFPENVADARGMACNSARCALEIAVLDAYGRHFGESMGEAIRRVNQPDVLYSPKPRPVRYSGAITASSRVQELRSAFKMWVYGFRHVKLKVGVEGQDDPARMRAMRRMLGRRIDVRLDANESWRPDEVVARIRPLLPFRPSLIEQPVAHDQVETLAGLRPLIGLPVMLDESLCSVGDALHAIEHQTADLFNVRLSKCGGLLRSLKIVGLARRAGLGMQLGCHPGESGILSAAGRQFAANVEELRYVEGSYDRHILTRNLLKSDITFGYGGWAPPLGGPGLGVQVDAEALSRLTRDRVELSYD